MNAAKIRARLQEIQARLQAIQAGELTDEVTAEIEALSTETEELTGKLTAAEKAEAMLAKVTASAGRRTDPAPTGNTPLS